MFQGQIHRGDIFSRESTLGFLDVRGFTAASERLPTETLLDLLNTFFEFVYDAVYAVGGEILKFYGRRYFIYSRRGQESTANM